MNDLLILKGANSTDDLSAYGMAIADRFFSSKNVILANKEGKATYIKGNGKFYDKIDLIDLEDPLGEISLILRKIYDAHQSAHPDTRYLARSFVGNWLFIWYFRDDSTIGLMMRGQLDLLRESADNFIERDFGMNGDAILNADGTKKFNSSAKTISGDDGPGENAGSNSI